MRPIIISAALVFSVALGCSRNPDSGAAQAASDASVVTPEPPSQEPSTSRPPGNEAEALTLVTDHSLVCMVNNQFMGKPQIPVTVNGNTYYGCCDMCKGRLEKDPGARTALDPVSGRSVDKAVAVIAKAGSGQTLYFENERNFAAYAERSRAN